MANGRHTKLFIANQCQMVVKKKKKKQIAPVWSVQFVEFAFPSKWDAPVSRKQSGCVNRWDRLQVLIFQRDRSTSKKRINDSHNGSRCCLHGVTFRHLLQTKCFFFLILATARPQKFFCFQRQQPANKMHVSFAKRLAQRTAVRSETRDTDSIIFRFPFFFFFFFHWDRSKFVRHVPSFFHIWITCAWCLICSTSLHWLSFMIVYVRGTRNCMKNGKVTKHVSLPKKKCTLRACVTKWRDLYHQSVYKLRSLSVAPHTLLDVTNDVAKNRTVE